MKATLISLSLLALLGCIGEKPTASDPLEYGIPGTMIALNKRENTASVIDMRTGETLKKIESGPNPNEVAFSDDGKTAVIANLGSGNGQQAGKTYTVVSLPDMSVVKHIELTPHEGPHGVVWIDKDRVVGTSHATNSVIVVNITTGKVEKAISTEQQGTHLVVLSPDKKQGYAVNAISGSVSVIDLEAGKLVKNIPCEARCEGIAISPDGKWITAGNVAANTVSIIDVAKMEVVKTVKDTMGPIRTFWSKDGKTVLVSCAMGGELALIDPQKWEISKRIKLSDQKVKFELGGQPAPIPMNYAMSPDGKYVYVVMIASKAVAVVDTTK
ncbi:MAG: beta-propeller fold lactonase family protein [Fimbriimonadaceae bacterium]|nr:beta-propeller fold lactonase family protein [Fimbriimonadaceae bacterium]